MGISRRVERWFAFACAGRRAIQPLDALTRMTVRRLCGEDSGIVVVGVDPALLPVSMRQDPDHDQDGQHGEHRVHRKPQVGHGSTSPFSGYPCATMSCNTETPANAALLICCTTFNLCNQSVLVSILCRVLLVLTDNRLLGLRNGDARRLCQAL